MAQREFSQWDRFSRRWAGDGATLAEQVRSRTEALPDIFCLAGPGGKHAVPVESRILAGLHPLVRV